MHRGAPAVTARNGGRRTYGCQFYASTGIVNLSCQTVDCYNTCSNLFLGTYKRGMLQQASMLGAFIFGNKTA